MKRSIDFLLGTCLLLLALPVMVFAIVGTVIFLRTWPLFTQERVGLGGRPIRFVKIRTLPRSAPRYADKYQVASERIPWFSATLRRLHLDELPQLLLVITGKMSLVGPRPEMPQLHDEMEPAFARLRTSVKPGCTGLWQISPACSRLIAEDPEYDLYYVQHQSRRLDVWVLWRTVTMLFTLRTTSLDDLPSWAAEPTALAPQAVIDLTNLLPMTPDATSAMSVSGALAD